MTVVTSSNQTSPFYTCSSVFHRDTTPPSKIVHTTEETLPRHTYCTLAQIRINQSPFLKSYLHKVDVNTHFALLSPLQIRDTYHSTPVQLHTHTHNSVAPGFVDRSCWSGTFAVHLGGRHWLSPIEWGSRTPSS